MPLHVFTKSEVKIIPGKTIYRYKKFEKLEFEDLTIEGSGESDSDLSLVSRFQKKFKNRLPYRTNFNPEIKRSLERVR